MPYLMSNSPSEEITIRIFPVFIQPYRSALRQMLYRIPLDTDMISPCIHKRSFKHPHITDIQVLGRQAVLCRCLAAVI